MRSAAPLRTVGRKSGEERPTAVAWFPWTGDSVLVVASAGGGARHPAWFLNLAAIPVVRLTPRAP